jgi:hypothetical protein
MITGSKRYDPELQMFVSEPREPDLNRLLFLRWLHEQGRLGYPAPEAASSEQGLDARARQAIGNQ